MGIITTFFDAVTQPLEASINSTATAVIGAITPTASILLTMYICFWGWALIRGSIQEPLMDAVTRFMKLVTVYVIAVNMAYYMGFLGTWIWQSGDAMAGVITGGMGYGGGGVSDTASAINFIDRLWDGFGVYGGQYWDYAYETKTAGIPNIGFLIGAVMIWLVGAILCFFAAFLFILAKMAIAVLLGIGPIFVLCTMFDATKKFFEGWLSQVLNFVVVIILTAAIMAVIGTEITRNISEAYKAAAGITGAGKPNMQDLMVIVGLSILVFLFLLQVQSIASGLAGGVALGVARIPYLATAKNAFRAMQGSARYMSKSGRVGRETTRRQLAQNDQRNKAWRARQAEQRANRGNSVERGSSSSKQQASEPAPARQAERQGPQPNGGTGAPQGPSHVGPPTGPQLKSDPKVNHGIPHYPSGSGGGGGGGGGSGGGRGSSPASPASPVSPAQQAAERPLPTERMQQRSTTTPAPSPTQSKGQGQGQSESTSGQGRASADRAKPQAAPPASKTNETRASQIRDSRRDQE